ncbi:MAG: DUF2029 domain-containing protein, partial [Alphaproteobacteria bacterium]|nr:DUF2029 domain-containing protein [Alphaproteobacteria bacterium]
MLTHDLTRAAVRLFALAAVPVLMIGLSGYFVDGLTNGAGKVVGEDFVNYWTSGGLWLRARAVEAYDLDGFRAAIRALAGAPVEPYHFSYPPTMMALAAPFAALPFLPALAAWTAAGYGALYLLLRQNAGPAWSAVAALAAPAALVNALYGQNGAFTAVFLGGALMALPTRPVVAGVLFGLLAFKPHLGVLVPLVLALGGHWRTFAAAAFTAVLAGLAAGAVGGFDAWAVYPARMDFMR